MIGLLNISKPAGVTSRDVVNGVQAIVRPAKAGHAGTLDPLATGVLVVCLGRATRLVPLIQKMRKTYRATFRLGRTSDTDDVEGAVVERADVTPPMRTLLLGALPEFIGRIEQRPPAYSAVKVAGRRAHQMARQGQRVELAPRPVDVYRIDLLRYEFPELLLEIECGSGTYVRSIGRDLGERLGCGAVMSALERTAIGPFTGDTAVQLADVTRESLPDLLLPAALATVDLPQVLVDAAGVRELVNGRRVREWSMAAASDATGINPVAQGTGRPRAAPHKHVAVLDEAGGLVALAENEGQQLRPRQVFAERP